MLTMRQCLVKVVHREIVSTTNLSARKFYMDGLKILGKYLSRNNSEVTLFSKNFLISGGITWIILMSIAQKLHNKIISNNAPLILWKEIELTLIKSLNWLMKASSKTLTQFWLKVALNDFTLKSYTTLQLL